jgi:GNAT superfamily N-acetyltransferase
VKEMENILEIDIERVGDAFFLFKQLHEGLTEEIFEERIGQIYEDGYRLFGLASEEGRIVSIAGVNILNNFSNGKFVYVYDLITDRDNRGKGFGKLLLEFIHVWAMEEGCEKMSLVVGTESGRSGEFYVNKMEYELKGYCYKKVL